MKQFPTKKTNQGAACKEMWLLSLWQRWKIVLREVSNLQEVMSRLYYFLSERRNQFMSCLDEHGVCSDVTLGINGVFWPLLLLLLQQVDSGILTCTWFPLDSPHLTLEYPAPTPADCLLLLLSRSSHLPPHHHLRRPSKSFHQTNRQLEKLWQRSSSSCSSPPSTWHRHSHPVHPRRRCVDRHFVTFLEKKPFEAPDSSYLTLT